jgi:hypothetical protein
LPKSGGKAEGRRLKTEGKRRKDLRVTGGKRHFMLVDRPT